MRAAARQFTSRANGSSDPVTASRFARDILVQETGWPFLRERGIDLIASDSPGAFLDETPTAIMIRQLLGVISEFEKASLVAKLRGARQRKKAAAGKCEGRKSIAELRPDVVALARELRRRRPKPIGTNHLPSRAILEADKHFRFVGVDAELMRKSFVNAALAGVRIHGAPNCFSALRICWQHVPIGRWLVDHGRRGPMQTNVILTGSAVPNADSAFSTPLQITPNVHLVIAWSPVVRDPDFRPALGIRLAVEADRLLRCVKQHT
jgi:hypothetical protein